MTKASITGYGCLMQEHFRALVLHQAKYHQALTASWGTGPGAEKLGILIEGLVHDGLWLSKFPVHHTPTYGVLRLDALNKAWAAGSAEGEGLAKASSEVADLLALVDADVLRFILKLKPDDYQTRVEIFYGGRGMNKALWQYLASWFERGAWVRGRLGTVPGMLDTVFT